MIQELVPASHDHFLALLKVLRWKAGDFRRLLENDLDSSDGRILPLSVQFLIASQRILNLPGNFGTSVGVWIILLNDLNCIVNLLKEFRQLCCRKASRVQN
jgi:hypothetical protein